MAITFTAEGPHRTVQEHLIGQVPTDITPLGYTLKIDGTLYPMGYFINYPSQGYRRIFVTTSNGNVYVTVETLVVSGTIASLDLNNVEVEVIV